MAARAGKLGDHLAEVRKFADDPRPPGEWSAIKRPAKREGSAYEAYDWGDKLMCAALVQRLQPDAARLERLRQMLGASLDYYDACFAQGKSVNWYARAPASVGLCALDWTWNELPSEQRAAASGRLPQACRRRPPRARPPAPEPWRRRDRLLRRRQPGTLHRPSPSTAAVWTTPSPCAS